MNQNNWSFINETIFYNNSWTNSPTRKFSEWRNMEIHENEKYRYFNYNGFPLQDLSINDVESGNGLGQIETFCRTARTKINAIMERKKSKIVNNVPCSSIEPRYFETFCILSNGIRMVRKMRKLNYYYIKYYWNTNENGLPKFGDCHNWKTKTYYFDIPMDNRGVLKGEKIHYVSSIVLTINPISWEINMNVSWCAKQRFYNGNNLNLTCEEHLCN